MGGNRCSKIRQYWNIMVTFLVSGLWHGANWTFIVWGGLHGALQIIEKMLGLDPKGRYGKPSIYIKPLRILTTFLFVNFAWIFFRAPSIAVAGNFVVGMIPGVNPQPFMAGFDVVDKVMMGASTFDWWIIVVSLLMLTVMDVAANRERQFRRSSS